MSLGKASEMPTVSRNDRLPLGILDCLAQAFAQLEYFFSVEQRLPASLGGYQSAPLGRQQSCTHGLFQKTDLHADGLHRNIEALGSTGETALLGRDPEVTKVSIVQGRADSFSYFTKP